MKKIYLVRHAKSSWGDFTTPDFDRPLNERGKRDAPVMAKRLLKQDVKIDQFVSSPAKRAKKTCQAFCEVYDRDKKEIHFIDELYHASVETFFKTVASLDDKFHTVAIFSHNPGITDFVNALQSGTSIDNMPTCAIFAAQCDIDRWKDFPAAQKKFISFDYPKSTED